ncbi:MAG: TonB-dependent receptor plug domain-containing protein [Roseateles asaccharophilus]|uniref:Iron complex outermembrane receptor protein n=1 Tax=Roseateles asaccharophilus TaxID=582607 RepID=A0A4R6NAL4_9BURK|nr:TonB-dependent receptor [Roseateles asaccharophilus]MDN3544986.1 TonB-dependent receptor [Roseateles asaccharophilus]TDP12628.1 iron complex outermembrane receptor protein [Roseateles asaccharophilus]
MTPRHSLIALAAMMVALQAQAQTTGSNTLNRVEVTGSMIKRISAETPSPVQVISRREIEESGVTTVDEFLRQNPAVGAGSLNDTASNSFNSGTASIGLRGLGSAATLTLLNGRRLGAAPTADPNTGRSTIYNLNAIPMAAVDRIEILKDGASATYGSDAIAGVVNIILRKDFDGLAIDAGTAFNDDGKHRVDRASLAYGFGESLAKGLNLVATLDFNSRKPVRTADTRDDVQADLYGRYEGSFTPSSTSVPTGNYYTLSGSGSGTFRQAGSGCPDANIIGKGLSTAVPLWTTASFWRAGECRFDTENDPNAQRVGAQDRVGSLLRASYAVNDTTQVFGELMLSSTKSVYGRANPTRTESRTVWANADAKLQVFDGLRLPVGHPDNPFNTTIGMRYRFADIQSQDISETRNARFLAGVSTTVGAWDIETAVLHHYQTLDQRVTNQLTVQGLKNAIATRSYRFNGQTNSAQAINDLVDDVLTEGVSRYTSVDVRATRELFQLPGGMAALGTGAELRKESMSVQPDALLASGGFIGRGSASASGSRNSGAAYVELQLPLLKQLETQVALRAENYQDFGSATTGKLGAKYQLGKAAAIRSTYATAFRAPALSQINAGNVASFSNSSNPEDPLRCPVTKATADCSSSRSIPAAILANKELRPETSKSFTLGLLLEPSRYVNLAIDGFYYDRRNEVNRPSVADVLRNPTAFPGGIVRNPDPSTWLPGVPNSGPIDYVVRQFRNLNRTIVAGFDIDGRVRLPLPETMGVMELGLQTTTLTRRDSASLPDDPLTSDRGDEDTPTNRGSVSAKWSGGDWRLSGKLNHVDPMRNTSVTSSVCKRYTDGGNPELCGIARWNTVDLGVGYKGFKNLNLSLNIDNVLDRKANYDALETTSFNNQYHSGRGRYFSFSAKYKY